VGPGEAAGTAREPGHTGGHLLGAIGGRSDGEGRASPQQRPAIEVRDQGPVGAAEDVPGEQGQQAEGEQEMGPQGRPVADAEPQPGGVEDAEGDGGDDEGTEDHGQPAARPPTMHSGADGAPQLGACQHQDGEAAHGVQHRRHPGPVGTDRPRREPGGYGSEDEHLEQNIDLARRQATDPQSSVSSRQPNSIQLI
jgi:hypothetical protein